MFHNNNIPFILQNSIQSIRRPFTATVQYGSMTAGNSAGKSINNGCPLWASKKERCSALISSIQKMG